MTRGWPPQRAGLPGLNGGGAAAAVPPLSEVTGTTLSTNRLADTNKTQLQQTTIHK